MAEIVKFIVASNDGPFDATLEIVLTMGTIYPLRNGLLAGAQNVRNDLATVEGLVPFTDFQVRVVTNIQTEATALDELAFSLDTPDSAFFKVGGTAGAPTIIKSE